MSISGYFRETGTDKTINLMGFYRFLLSILVLFSHTGVGFWGLGVGVTSVISFYMISGYTMQILWDKYYCNSKFKYFYIDRFFRIAPLFYVYLTIYLLCSFFIKSYSPAFGLFFSDNSFGKILSNYLIIPLGYYMFNGLSDSLIIPQAHTLGLECTFYILFPFIYYINSKFKKNNKFSYLLQCLSIGIFLLAYTGKINTDIFGYRLILGTLWIFITGSLMASSKFLNIVLIELMCLLLYRLQFIYGYDRLPFNKEVLMGTMIGGAMLLCIKYIKIKIKHNVGAKINSISSYLGDLSYGIYLNHMLIIYFFEAAYKKGIANYVNSHVLFNIVLVSIVLSIITYELVDKKVYIYRKYLRQGNYKCNYKFLIEKFKTKLFAKRGNEK